MAEIKIISENPLTLVEVKEKISKINERDKELGFRLNKSKEYVDTFTKLKPKEVEELKKKLTELNIPRLRDRHIVKIIDIYPTDMDSLKTVFAGEPVTIKQEELKKILDTINA